MERGKRPGFLMTQRDHDWLDEAISFRWEVPEKASAFWRSWGVRHVRATWIEIAAYATFYWRKASWPELWRREWLAYGVRRGWF
jgi:hypothetical protein